MFVKVKLSYMILKKDSRKNIVNSDFCVILISLAYVLA